MIAATLQAELIIPGTPEWTAARSTGIGASEAGAACGVSDYRTPLDIYLIKRGLKDEAEENDAMRLGKRLEPVIIAEYQDRAGVQVQCPVPLIRHPQYSFMFATPDGLVGIERGLECKATTYRQAAKLGEEGTDFVFDEWVMQCQQGMSVTGRVVWDLAVLIDGRTLRVYTIDRNELLIAGIVSSEHELWERIVNSDPPPPNWTHPKTPQLIRELHGLRNGLTIYVGDREQACWDALKAVRERSRRLDQLAEALKARVLWGIGNADAGILPDGRIIERRVIERKSYTVQETCYERLVECKAERQVLPMPKKRRAMTAEKNALLKLGNRCRWCGAELTKKNATVDHLVPRSRGGSDALNNLCLACKGCNTLRADSGLDPKYLEAK